jgi:DNA-binding NarL/FixJ family response regulator
MEVEEFSKFFVPDVVLLDLNIIDSNGMDTFERVLTIFPKSAIIILSGMDDQNMALEIVKNGAQDYILKSDLNNKVLLKTIEYSFERKDLLDRIQKSEKQFRDVFEQSPLPMFSVEGPNLVIKLVNNAAKEIYGFEKRLLIGRELQSLNFDKK